MLKPDTVKIVCMMLDCFLGQEIKIAEISKLFSNRSKRVGEVHALNIKYLTYYHYYYHLTASFPGQPG